jgi:hypothetical protein
MKLSNARYLAVGLVWLVQPMAFAQEGSCAHTEMRTWVDQEEVCYHTYGPLNERYSLSNAGNLETLDECLNSAKSAYVSRRMVCELRGETPYRADGIHRDWERYRTAYKTATERLRNK